MRLRIQRMIFLSMSITLLIVGGNAHVFAQVPPPVEIFVEEGIGVDDGTDAVPPATAEANEDISVTDEVTVTPPAIIEVNETVGISDDPTLIGPATLDVEDSISVSDGVTITPPAIVNVNESILVELGGGPVSSTPVVDAGTSISAYESQPITLQASVITLNPDLTTALIEWGDGNSDPIVPTASGAISALHLYEGDGNFTVTVTVTGPFGDTGDDTVAVKVLNHAPFVNAGGPYGGVTSAAIVLTAEGTDPGDDPLTYAWDFDDDGQFDDASGQAVIFSSPTPGVFPVAVQATDDGGLEASDTVDVPVTGSSITTKFAPGFGQLLLPSIDSPSNGSFPASGNVDFEWSPGGYTVEQWQLRVGTAPGVWDILESGVLPANTTSMAVALPTGPIFARLSFYAPGDLTLTGGWGGVDATYTVPSTSLAPGSLPGSLLGQTVITAPTGSVTGLTFTVEWNAGGDTVDHWRVEVRSSTGQIQTTDVASSPTSLEVTVQTPGAYLLTVLPLQPDGASSDDVAPASRSILVLQGLPGGTLSPISLPSIDSPVDGSSLYPGIRGIEWSANGTPVDYWMLFVGDTPGGRSYGQTSMMAPEIDSTSVYIPVGSVGTVYVRLWYFSASATGYVDAAYTLNVVDNLPDVRWDTDNGNPSGTSGTIVWTHDDDRVAEYRVLVGSSVGASDIFDSGALAPAQKSLKVTGLPGDDSPIFVRFSSKDSKLNVLQVIDLVNLGENGNKVTSGKPPVDTDAPVTTIEFAGQHTLSAGTHFIDPDTQIYFLATDDNPVSIEYDLVGDGRGLRPAFPFRIAEPGLYTIDYRATDSEGNVEATKTALISVGGQATTRLRPLDGVKDGRGPEITLQAKNLSGDRPVRVGDRILVKAKVVRGTGSTGSGTRGFDESLSALNSYEVTITSGGSDGVAVDWEPAGAAGWIFTVPDDSFGAEISIKVTATDQQGVIGPSAFLIVIHRQDQTLPTVDLVIAPPPGDTGQVEAGDAIYIQAYTGLESVISRVDIFVDNVPVYTGISGPHTAVVSDTLARLGNQQSQDVVIKVVVAAEDSAFTTSAVEVITIVPPGPNFRGDTSKPVIGKSSGRAVIGTLLKMTSSEIVVGTDLGAVRVHIDQASTEISASLDAEAYTQGSRVVVVADRDVNDPEAVALKIAHIPSPGTKAKRQHKRVVVADPDAGNTQKLVDDDGTVLDAGKSGEFDTTSGDQVVLIVKKDRNGRDKDVKIVAKTDEVDDRLDRIARKKFEDGKTGDSASVDELRKDRRDKAEAFVEKVSKNDDADIREAAEDAVTKIKNAKEKEAADPLTAIRKQAVAETEGDILRCAAGIVGRAVSGESDLSPGELARVEKACLSEDDQDKGRRVPEDQRDREEPPAEVIECIIKVFGEIPTSLSESDRQRLDAACGTDSDEKGDDGKGKGDGGREPSGGGTTESDARKIAYCQSNPSEPRCDGVDQLINPDDFVIDPSTPHPGGGGGGKDAPSQDFTEGQPDGRDAELKKLCDANPGDPKCGDRSDPDKSAGDSTAGDAEKRAFCDANPSDSSCADDTGEDSGGAKDDGSKTGTKGDGGSDSSGTKDDGGDKTGTKSGGK